jgi:flagellin-specific chaperone FliS
MPPKNYKKITNPKHIRMILSRTINMLLNDEIDSQCANSISTLCNIMLKVIRATELEDRIKKLEEVQDGKEPTKAPVTSDIKEMIKEMRN